MKEKRNESTRDKDGKLEGKKRRKKRQTGRIIQGREQRRDRLKE